jgi:predicted ATP-grasp superfamily ATP-dependent carboligase
MARILLLGSPGHPELSFTRAAWRSGHVCDLAWPRHEAANPVGRSVARWHSVRPIDHEGNEFIEDVVRVIKDGRHDVVVPYGLSACWVSSKHAPRLRGVTSCLLPGFDRFEIANDKRATARWCESLGIACPQLYEGFDEDDVDTLVGTARFPVVVKPRSGSARAVRFATDATALRAAIDHVRSQHDRTGAEYFEAPVVQEFVPGHLHDACSVSRAGETPNLLTQVRQVMWPIVGGVGAITVTTDNQRVRALARKLLASLEWEGPAQIEFRHDPRDGDYKLIEINPKFWGTLDQSVRVGMDFPTQTVDLAHGRTVRVDQPYAVGVRYRFWFPRALWARRQLDRAFGPGGWKDSRTYRRTFNQLDLRDPMPDVARLLRWVRHDRRRARGAEVAAFPRELLTHPAEPWEG